VVAQPDLVAQRLGAFRAFPVDGEQGFEVSFAAAGLDLVKFFVLVAPRGAQANVVLFLLPQLRQPGGGLGLKCFAACYDDVVLVTALEMPNDLPALRLGELEKARDFELRLLGVHADLIQGHAVGRGACGPLLLPQSCLCGLVPPTRGLEGAEHSSVRHANARVHARPTKRSRRPV
jgi:hypothetical protein